MKRLGTKADNRGRRFHEGNEDNVRSRGLAAPYARFDRTLCALQKKTPPPGLCQLSIRRRSL